MSLDPQLLEMVACPTADHAPLRHDPQAETLTCTSCGRVYPVKDGLPVLLVEEALEVK
ncbi:MAG TPA: Trm112 family protein [Candidatus Limnocylindrales bacterium]